MESQNAKSIKSYSVKLEVSHVFVVEVCQAMRTTSRHAGVAEMTTDLTSGPCAVVTITSDTKSVLEDLLQNIQARFAGFKGTVMMKLYEMQET